MCSALDLEIPSGFHGGVCSTPFPGVALLELKYISEKRKKSLLKLELRFLPCFPSMSYKYICVENRQGHTELNHSHKNPNYSHLPPGLPLYPYKTNSQFITKNALLFTILWWSLMDFFPFICNTHSIFAPFWIRQTKEWRQAVPTP